MHLYKSWDDSYYLTNKYDGKVGHIVSGLSIKSVKAIYNTVGFKKTASIVKAMLNMRSTTTVYTIEEAKG
jgi:hypothetical protein